MSRSVSQLLTAGEVAARFGVSVRKIQRLTRSGRLPAVKIAGRWRYHRRHLPRSVHRGAS